MRGKVPFSPRSHGEPGEKLENAELAKGLPKTGVSLAAEPDNQERAEHQRSIHEINSSRMGNRACVAQCSPWLRGENWAKSSSFDESLLVVNRPAGDHLSIRACAHDRHGARLSIRIDHNAPRPSRQTAFLQRDGISVVIDLLYCP